jgi:hypothetical protein
MQSTTESKWPDELDALIAAPQHHKLLFENENVRVLDACIPPGDTTELHTHKWPSTLYILSWSDFIRYDKDGTILLDSRNLAAPLVQGTALWSGPLMPHVLKNIGLADLHVISVELKQIK